MNFLFVDRILSIEPAKKIVGVKHVTAHDVYLQKNQQGKWQLLSCIIGETLGQLAAWAVMQHNNFTARPVAGVVGEVKILGEACLGDTILLESSIDSLDEEAVMYNAVASVRGKPILTLTNALGPILPMEQFIDPTEVKKQFAMINRRGEFKDSEHLPLLINGAEEIKPQPVQFDTILKWEKSQRVVAQKNVSIIAPYFVDHFPYKPVLPLSLLLECKLQLGYQFLREHLNITQIVPASITRIKMSDFVQPGESVITELSLKKQTETSCVLNFRSTVNEKKVCVVDAEYNF